jgi:hypothetical protein
VKNDYRKIEKELFICIRENNTPSLYVDGYFSSYPSNSTALLRRTANGHGQA